MCDRTSNGCVNQLSLPLLVYPSPSPSTVCSGGRLCDLINGPPRPQVSRDQPIGSPESRWRGWGWGRTVMSGRLFPWLSPQVPAGQRHSLTEGHSPSHNGPHFSFWVLITSPSPRSLRQEVVRGHCSVLCNFSTYCPNLCQ